MTITILDEPAASWNLVSELDGTSVLDNGKAPAFITIKKVGDTLEVFKFGKETYSPVTGTPDTLEP